MGALGVSGVCSRPFPGHLGQGAGPAGQTTAWLLWAFNAARSVWQVAGQSYRIHGLGPGMLTTGGHRNSGSTGPPAVPTPGPQVELPQVELRLPAWLAQGPQDTGAGSGLPYWPRGSAQGGEERPERAVPGTGTGRARAVPGMTVVGRGPDARAKNGVPTAARGVFIYKTRRGGHVAGSVASSGPGPTVSASSGDSVPRPAVGAS